jgi:integron integrase
MEKKLQFKPNPELKLMEQVREVLRYYHYSYRTENTYCQWIVRYIRFHGSKTHPKLMNSDHIQRFLSHLVINGNVSASTQKQALNALIFLYNKVLHIPLGTFNPIRSKRSPSPPAVLTKEEVQNLLQKMTGLHALQAKLLYGAGLRILECIRLRVQDVDFGQNLIYIRGGKGGKDRTSILPAGIRDELHLQIQEVKAMHHRDLEEGFGEVYLPNALELKYPNAAKETSWQYIFPSKERSLDPRSGRMMRHHVLESGLQKAVKRAADKSGIFKHVGCHTLRHSFATHMLENGINIRVLQELMGHADVKTTEIYTHVISRDIARLQSPLDKLNIPHYKIDQIKNIKN